MQVSALVDFFIDPSRYKSSDNLRRARILVRACLLTSLFSSTYLLLSIYFSFDKGVYFMTSNVLGFLVVAFLAKTKLPIAWIGNLFILLGGTAIITLTYYSGGMWSAIYPWIISIPVLAVLVVNRLSGVVWGIICLIAMMGYGHLALRGIELPVEYNTDLRTQWFASILPGLLLIVLVISFVFQNMHATALKRLADKNRMLESQKSTIVSQTGELEKFVEEKDYIIRILAHDLRNPLKNITSLVKLMDGETDRDRQAEYRTMILQATNSAQDLVKRVLEMDASDQRDVAVNLEQINAVEAMKEVVQALEEPAARKQIIISIKDRSTRAMVQADKTYLALIFENLLTNAMKFSENGTKVLVEIGNNEEFIELRIIDQGPGIAVEEQDKLFKKFTKLSARPTAGETSTGLGLSLVKRYLDLIGGKVWYEGREKAGAVFVVQLKLID